MNAITKKSVCVLALLFSLCLTGFTQTRSTELKGRVTEENGEPVVGAAIYYEGTSTSALTDANGEFSLPFLRGQNLVFSMFGMKQESVRPSDNRYLNVIMSPDNMTLDDAVVIGYGTTSRRDLTGSVASVKAEDIVATGSNNAIGALQGRVAGLSITSQSGEPGAGFSIKIRGNNSINAGTSPLIVIDGMQMNLSSGEIATSSTTGYGTFDPLSFLNPNDIESIEVLKDASATAIYGAKGANGVIMITTKSGIKGVDKTTVNFDSMISVSQNPRYIELLNPQEYADYRFTKADYGGKVAFGVDTDYDGEKDEPIDASGYTYYDWQRLVYRNALSRSYNVSLSSRVGGKTQIASSIGYLNQEGLVRGNDQKRYTARIKLDHQINEKWKMGVTVNFGRTVSTGAVNSGYNGIIQMIYRERPLQKWTPSEEDQYRTTVFGLTSLITDETFKQTTYNRITSNAYANWNFAKNWQLKINAAGGLSDSDMLEYYSSKSRWGYNVSGKGGELRVSTFNYNASSFLQYNKTWNKTHHFDAMAGGEITYYKSMSMGISGYTFEDESTSAYNISKAVNLDNPSQSVGDNSKLSFISRANYNYKQKYYLTATFRADGSSKFHAGNRVGYFPSISAAWRVIEEPWIKASAPWISEFKIRASAGASGNDRIGNYQALATIGTNYYSTGGTEIMGMSLSSSSNPKLKWETTYQYDAGLDFSILDDRFGLVVDVYYKDTRDMLYNAIVSAQTGFNTQWKNLGKVTNNGIELALTSHNISTKNFSWTTNLSFDLSRNKVVDIGDNEYVLVNIGGGTLTDISRIVPGEPIGIGWGYECIGNYQLDDFIITRKSDTTGRIYPSEAVTSANYNQFIYTLKEGQTTIAGKTIVPGDRKYKDLDGDNEITTNDRKKISNSNPLFSASLGNTFTWKNWDLNIFLEGLYGRTILNEYNVWSESGISGGNSSYNLRKEAWYGHWTPENGSNTFSQLSNNTNTWCSSYYVEDGSYLRIKTLALGYNLPRRALTRVKMSSLRLALNVDNAWVFTRYSGNDPDVSSSNALFTAFDRMSYPKPRTYSFSLNIGF